MAILSELKFPLYKLPLRTEWRDNKLLGWHGKEWKLIYDKSIGGTLTYNRLHSDTLLIKLYNFYKVLYAYQDLFILFKKSRLNLTFIDSQGKLIDYVPSKNVPLNYYRIIKTTQQPQGYVLHLEGIHQRFLRRGPPDLDQLYAGVLLVDRGYVLYELSKDKKADTRRKI